MGIELKLRFHSLDITFDGTVDERSLLSLARTITTLLGQPIDRLPLQVLSTLIDQVENSFPALSFNEPLTTLRTWLTQSEAAAATASSAETTAETTSSPSSQGSNDSPNDPSNRPPSLTSDELPALDWLKVFLEDLLGQAIRPMLDEIQTQEANELLNGLPDKVDGEIFRVGIWIWGDRPSNAPPFNAADRVDDALAAFKKERASAFQAPSQAPSQAQSLLPIPEHFQGDLQGDRLESVWRVPYQIRAAEAQAWAQEHQIPPASDDTFRTALVLIDVQNTFCLPDFELFVAGRSGKGAVEDNQRLCEFIYRNLHHITDIIPTLDTHGAAQIFHPAFWVDSQGRSPQPMTIITAADVESGTWQVNPHLVNPNFKTGFSRKAPTIDLQAWALHYVQQLEQAGKYPLTVWPFHSMLGGIGHALVSAVEEAVFFHSIARHSPTQYELKGENPLTERYSALGPEVGTAADGAIIDRPNNGLIDQLLDYDRVIIAGQAKSHCVAWTVADLLNAIQAKDPAIAQKVYLLEDCTSPVVVPGIVDFSDAGDRAFAEFAAAGMHRVRSTDSF